MSKYSKIIFIICLFSLFSRDFESLAQQKASDSLIVLLKEAKQDTTKIRLMNEIAWATRNVNPPKAVDYGRKALELAQQLKIEKTQSVSLNFIGVAYRNMSDYANALLHFHQALAFSQKLHDSTQIAYSLNNISGIYRLQSDYPKALAYSLQALKTFEALKDSTGSAFCALNIGLIYYGEEKYKDAEKYVRYSLKLRELLKEEENIILSRTHLANIFEKQGLLEESLIMHQQIFANRQKKNDLPGIAFGKSNLARIYLRQKFYEKSIKTAQESITILLKLNNHEQLALSYEILAEAYSGVGKYKEAVEVGEKAFLSAKKIGAKNLMRNISQTLYEIHKKFRQEHLALSHLETYLLYKDSLLNEEKAKELGRLEAMFKFEKMQQKFEQEQKEKEWKLKLELEEKQIIQTTTIIVIFLLVFLISVIYRLYWIKRKSNLELTRQQIHILQKNQELELLYKDMEQKLDTISEQKQIILQNNNDLAASIAYAQRIQQAMLPSPELFKELIPNYFILYKPRDIVSGDFYWLGQTISKPIYEEKITFEGVKKVFTGFESAKTFVAVVDCTGHGVPGALMSMLGNDLLNQIILERGVSNPSKILEEIDKGIGFVLKQEYSQDGMDIVLLSIDKERKQITYSGAMIPLYYVEQEEGNVQFHERKATKRPIGSTFLKEKHFENQTFTYSSPTTFYLCTDGYQDQFGGAKGKKFLVRRLKELLYSIHHKPLLEQKRILETTFDNWKGEANEPQVDDLTIIGFRL
jgi:serine phosphatase RsbU (regulator of sigma subunit)